MLYMVTWIPSIYPSHVSIYTSTMDPMGMADAHRFLNGEKLRADSMAAIFLKSWHSHGLGSLPIQPSNGLENHFPY